MIAQYHRPESLEEALALLERPNTVPLGGGTLLSRPGPDSIEVVDLQRLGLDSLHVNGNELQIGATCRLQALIESAEIHAAVKQAVKLEAPLNLRNSASAAGTLAAADGRSTFAVMMLALDAKLDIYEGRAQKTLTCGEYLLTRPKCLITSISISLNVNQAFEYISKTPADKPLVCAGMARWPSGRTRLTLGGYGANPLLGMDGAEGNDAAALVNAAQTAARSAFHEARDEFASAEYRMEAAATLAKRCLAGMMQAE